MQKIFNYRVTEAWKRLGLGVSIRFFNLSVRPAPIDVTLLQLDREFGNKKKVYNSLQKYIMVKRKSLLTGGHIGELKGQQVETLLRNTSREWIREFGSQERSDVMELLMLDHSSVKNSQAQLLNLLRQQGATLSEGQRLFLVKSAVFCNQDHNCCTELDEAVRLALTQTLAQPAHPYSSIFRMVVYYKCLKERFRLFDKENNFFLQQRKTQLQQERKLREELGMKGLDPNKLFYEMCIEAVFEQTPSCKQIVMLIEELAYIGPLRDEEMLNMIYGSLRVEELSLGSLVGLIVSITSKNMSVSASIYNSFIAKLTTLMQMRVMEKNKMNGEQEKPWVYRNIEANDELREYLFGEEQRGMSFAEKNESELDLSVAVDCLWILTRNIREEEDSLREQLLACLGVEVRRLQIRQLLTLLHCFIGDQMHRNMGYISDDTYQFEGFNNGEINVKEIVRLLMERMRVSGRSIGEKQKCGLFLNLNYLRASHQISEIDIDGKIYNELREIYTQLTQGKNRISKTERLVSASLETMKEKKLIEYSFEQGVLLHDIYYVDFFAQPNIVLEVNGDLHLNQQTRALFTHNYLLKLFYFRFLKYRVIVLHSRDYLPLISDPTKLQTLLLTILQ